MEVKTFANGPLENNTYLLFDAIKNEALVIDPSLDCTSLIQFIDAKKLKLTQIWITHAHFDHTIGIKDLLAHFQNSVEIALHTDDLNLWNSGGGGRHFDLPSISNPPPTLLLTENQILKFSGSEWIVLHTPGHTKGCVVFYNAQMNLAFVGDLIFSGNIGRTDLPGGSFDQIIESIKTKIFTLPDKTVLYPGHGEPTSVGREKTINPFFV